MKGSANARLVIAAPAKAEESLGKDSERTICGGIEIWVFNQILRNVVNWTWILGNENIKTNPNQKGTCFYYIIKNMLYCI